MTINSMLCASDGSKHKSKVSFGSMRAYMEHAEHGSGAIVELYMTEYNTFAVQVMLDNGTIHKIVEGAVAGNAMNIKRYGPTYAVDGEADGDAYQEMWG
jgi:hypothetical protein